MSCIYIYIHLFITEKNATKCVFIMIFYYINIAEMYHCITYIRVYP